MTLPVSVYIGRLDQADELETALKIARAHGLTVEELLARRPPQHVHARTITEFYVALRERGYSPTRIGEFTGRTSQAIHQALRYRSDEAYRDVRKASARARHFNRKVPGESA